MHASFAASATETSVEEIESPSARGETKIAQGKDLQGKDAEGSFRVYFRQCLNLTNLVIFVYLFCSASFNYYLINFYMKYIPGNVFKNSIVASLSEAVSTLVSGLIVKLVGPRNAILLMNMLAGGSAICLWIAEKNGLLGLVPVFILMAKFGICAGFAMLYMSTLVYFPSRFLGAIFGVCNTAARACTILAPMIAEVDTPIPELTAIFTCSLAVLGTRFLRIPGK